MALVRIPYRTVPCDYHAFGTVASHTSLFQQATLSSYCSVLCLVGVVPSFPKSLKRRRNNSHLIYFIPCDTIVLVASLDDQITWVFSNTVAIAPAKWCFRTQMALVRIPYRTVPCDYHAFVTFAANPSLFLHLQKCVFIHREHCWSPPLLEPRVRLLSIRCIRCPSKLHPTCHIL